MLVIAHVRHVYTPYDKLLREGTERFEARRATGEGVWKVLRRWCPWDEGDGVLESCFRVTVTRPEEREPGWDPMDLDLESESEDEKGKGERWGGRVGDGDGEEVDRMDLD